MNSFINDLVPDYTRWIIRWRWWVMLLSVLLVGIVGMEVMNLKTTDDFRVYFGPENPELLSYNALEETYTKTDTILMVLQPTDKKIFTREALGIIKQATEDAWRIPYSIRVDSITNFQHTEAQGDDLTVGDLVARPQDLSNEQLDKIRKIALNEPALAKRLIAEDAGTTGILVTLQLPGNDHICRNRWNMRKR